MTDPILSRFDVLSVIKDEVDIEADDALATFVINSHIKSHPEVSRDMKAAQPHNGEPASEEDVERAQSVKEWLHRNLLDDRRVYVNEEDTIPQDILKKYIIYARKFVHPKLNEIDKEKVTQFYADIRRESTIVGGIPIAVRHIESVLRMSEAHAKIHLRDYVRTDDIDQAIDMLLESFLQSQKVSVARQLSKKFEQYRSKKTDPNQLLLHLLRKMVNDRVSLMLKFLISFFRQYMKNSLRELKRWKKLILRSPLNNSNTRQETLLTTMSAISTTQVTLAKILK